MITLAQYIYEHINEAITESLIDSILTEGREVIDIKEGDTLYTFFLEPKGEDYTLFSGSGGWGPKFISPEDWEATDKIVELKVTEVTTYSDAIVLHIEKTWITDKNAKNKGYSVGQYDFINMLMIALNTKKKNAGINVAEDGHIANIVEIGHGSAKPSALKIFTSKEAAEQASDKWLDTNSMKGLKHWIDSSGKRYEKWLEQNKKNEKAPTKVQLPLDRYLEYIKYVTGENIWDVVWINSPKETKTEEFWKDRLEKKKTPITVTMIETNDDYEGGSQYCCHQIEIGGKWVEIEPMPARTVKKGPRAVSYARWLPRLTGKVTLKKWWKENKKKNPVSE